MSARLPASLAVLLALLGAACSAERYFGPYSLEAPTALEERTAARTFELPLDAGDQAALEALLACERDAPDRQPPCACDLVVQEVAARELRLDYRLTHRQGEAAGVEVWVGAEAEAGAPDPAVLPDAPRVEVFALHRHHVGPGAVVVRSFSEAEMEAADLAWSAARQPACDPPSPGAGPAPLAWLVGLSLPGEERARVGLEFTVRVREGG